MGEALISHGLENQTASINTNVFNTQNHLEFPLSFKSGIDSTTMFSKIPNGTIGMARVFFSNIAFTYNSGNSGSTFYSTNIGLCYSSAANGYLSASNTDMIGCTIIYWKVGASVNVSNRWSSFIIFERVNTTTYDSINFLDLKTSDSSAVSSSNNIMKYLIITSHYTVPIATATINATLHFWW